MTFSVSFSGSGMLRHLLEVVDEDDQPPIARQAAVALDELAHVVDRAGRLRAAHQEEVLAIAGDAVHRRPQARVVGHLGVRLALRHPRPEDLLADILDLDRARLVGEVGERRLHRDQAVEQVLLVVLEADVQDVRLAARGDVARHLEGHRGLAGALRAADEQQLSGPQPRPDGLVERREPERDRLVLRDVPGVTLSLRSTRTSSAERGVRLPLSVSRRQTGALARVSGALAVTWIGSSVGSSRR